MRSIAATSPRSLGTDLTIEVDKRAGMSNAMSLQLSYSGDHFSVPANVDIIGAMNTADRSLALMDTALRRRFDFVEMMPDLSLLSGAKVKGIELESLLEKLNSRIEALYDREHTLGHAFFMPVKMHSMPVMKKLRLNN